MRSVNLHQTINDYNELFLGSCKIGTTALHLLPLLSLQASIFVVSAVLQWVDEAERPDLRLTPAVCPPCQRLASMPLLGH